MRSGSDWEAELFNGYPLSVGSTDFLQIMCKGTREEICMSEFP